MGREGKSGAGRKDVRSGGRADGEVASLLRDWRGSDVLRLGPVPIGPITSSFFFYTLCELCD